MATDILANQSLKKDEDIVKYLRGSKDSFSSSFEPMFMHTMRCGKTSEVLNVVVWHEQRIVLKIDLRIGNCPDKITKIVDMAERYTDLPGSVVEFNITPSFLPRK